MLYIWYVYAAMLLALKVVGVYTAAWTTVAWLIFVVPIVGYLAVVLVLGLFALIIYLLLFCWAYAHRSYKKWRKT